jgi:hypothetical protein
MRIDPVADRTIRLQRGAPPTQRFDTTSALTQRELLLVAAIAERVADLLR